MKKTLLAFSIALLPSLSFAQTLTPTQAVSYQLGYDMFEQLPTDIDPNSLIQGILDAQAKKPPRYSEQQIQQMMSQYQAEYEQKQRQIATGNAEKERLFLAENAKKAGVKTTASGLQYKIVKAGTGKKPNASSKVTVHYEGRLLDGTVFDSSYKRGEPISFPLNGVIKGWQEGLQYLPQGGKMQLFIPAKLAYGEQEMPSIPANSTLIFDVELLNVQ